MTCLVLLRPPALVLQSSLSIQLLPGLLEIQPRQPHNKFLLQYAQQLINHIYAGPKMANNYARKVEHYLP